MSSSTQLHNQAEHAREEERYGEALSLYRQALIAYQTEKNYLKIIELHCGEFLTYKHLFASTHDTVFLLLARQCISTALLIAKEFNISELNHMISFYSGEINVLNNKVSDAILSFKEALDEFEKREPENKVHIARYRYHYGHALCLNNQHDEGIQYMKQALGEIEANRDSLPEGTDGDYVYNVHLSGCLMMLALDLHNSNEVESKDYLEQALVIIELDPRLTIRKKQFEELSKKLQ